MARRKREDEIDEEPSEADLERFGGATRTCPECGTELYDDSEICWKCGHALYSGPKGTPVWAMVVGGVVVLAIVVGWLWSVMR